MTDKRAEALERARALRARYDSATTVHPSTYAQLADARELLALHAENEKLALVIKEQDAGWKQACKDAEEAEAQVKYITADNAAMLHALQRVRRAWVNNGAATEEMKQVCNDIDIEILGPTSPGQALLQRIEKLEALLRSVQGYGFTRSLAEKIDEALDGENKT